MRFAFVICSLFFGFGVVAPSYGQTPNTEQTEAEAPSMADIISKATPLGQGPAQLYQLDDKLLLALPTGAFNRDFLWYAEAAQMPTALVAVEGNAIGETMIRLQRRGNQVFVRDLSTSVTKRAIMDQIAEGQDNTASGAISGGLSGQIPIDPEQAEAKLSPLQISLQESNLAPIMASLPVIAADPDGSVLIDVTMIFASDIPGALSAAGYLARSGMMADGPDPSRSYIERARSHPNNISVRSHLTFSSGDGAALSMVVGHSLVLLPETPMASRAFDDRVGYFSTSFLDFGGPLATGNSSVVLRHRLEKKDPNAPEPAEPKKQIVYYVGQDVPERWRPAVTRGIEMWQPAFEQAGFKNAIIAKDAPTPLEDPDWSPEDARHNVIRWLAQPNANAMGPVIYDPRSGEILGAHVLLWPQVIEFIGAYYFVVHSAVDKEAKNYPISDTRIDDLLASIVAHEVGHTLGLRHNHMASTSYSTEQLRDPAFTNEHGPASSIMAYGRFNQVAKAGDGVTKFIPGIGTYDEHAITWGYKTFANKELEQNGLENLAMQGVKNRALFWAAGELPSELADNLDPRVQRENTGADRIEATRGGIERVKSTLQNLPEKVAGDRLELNKLFNQARAVHGRFVKSVVDVVGGVEGTKMKDGSFRSVSPEKQRAATMFLLTEGLQSYEIFNDEALLRRLVPGGAKLLTQLEVRSLIGEMFDGGLLTRLAMADQDDANAYKADEYIATIEDSLFDNEQPNKLVQTAQAAYLEQAMNYANTGGTDPSAIMAAVATMGLPAETLMAFADGTAATTIPAYFDSRLTQLKELLEARMRTTTDQELKLHYADLLHRMERAPSDQQEEISGL